MDPMQRDPDVEFDRAMRELGDALQFMRAPSLGLFLSLEQLRPGLGRRFAQVMAKEFGSLAQAQD